MGDSFDEWRRHFVAQARGLIPQQRNFYKVVNQHGKGGNEGNIKLVTPTQQAVERAKSTLSHPPVVYDPVTGIAQKTETVSKRQKRKYKKKDTRKKMKSRVKSKKPTKQKNKKKKPKEKKKKNSEDKWW